MRHDELYLWWLGQPDTPMPVGQLRLTDSGKGVSLQYGSVWLKQGFALSEDLILADMEHRPRWRGQAVGAVDDARPDRWGERVIQYLDRPARLSLMEYLFYAGDERFGALGVSLSATQYVPREGGPLPRLQQVQSLSQIAHKISAKEPVSDIERNMMRCGGSFGGAKPKALIEMDGQQWVVKFFDGEPLDIPLIEHASMTLASRAGIRVALTRPIPLPGEHALAVLRYDRAGRSRIHCISAATALRAETPAGMDPDFAYPQLAQILRRAGISQNGQNLHDMQELFRRMVFNILMDNTDDHEKNHALQVVEPTQHGRFRLSPAYDVLPSNSGQGRQEFRVGDMGHESSLDNALSQCELFGLDRQQAVTVIREVIGCVDGWKSHFSDCGVSAADIDLLAHQIDGEVLMSERRSFDRVLSAGATQTSKTPRKRRRPFE